MCSMNRDEHAHLLDALGAIDPNKSSRDDSGNVPHYFEVNNEALD